MLISFAVRNFRSIYERQELTFVAGKYNGLEQALLSGVPRDVKVLPAIAVYGSNAAGKTNFLRALHFIGVAIARSHDSWKAEEPIPYAPHFFHEDEPSEIEVEFSLERKCYKYSVAFNRERFLSEALYEGRNVIFRRTGNRFKLTSSFDGYESVKRITRKNSLFLSACAQNNHALSRKVHAWFSGWHTVTDDRTMEEAFTGFLLDRPEMREFLTKALSIVSSDIVEVLPSEDPLYEVRSEADPNTSLLMKDYAKWITTQIVHKVGKKRAVLRLSQESKGTQSYFALASTIAMTLFTGSVFILDEADQSMHPMLLKSLVSLFQKKKTNPRRAQLVFNTHDTTLLTPDSLRPDQVWFVERAPGEGSKIYCLADFEGIRSDTKAQKAYLDGRFGAVPFLEDHENLFAGEVVTAFKRK